MQVKQYTPKLKVLAWHGTNQYDLTPYILQVRTHHAFGETAGQWALLLTFEKRWDQILATMDYVEIYMSRYSPAPRIIMRGFVSNIRRTRTLNPQGKWRRTITINGNNYGKLFQKYQIYYLANIPGQVTNNSDTDPAQQLLYPLLTENLGAFQDSANGIVSLSSFIPQLVDATVSKWISAMQKDTPTIPSLSVDVNVLSDYVLSWLTLQSMQGGLDSSINQYANTPWCEWFVYDGQDGPKVIHRNTPFLDANGTYIFPESELGDEFASVDITDADVIEDDIGTTDSETYDYFFTYPSLFTAGDLAYKFTVISSTDEFGQGDAESMYAQEGDLSVPTNPKLLQNSIYKYGLNIMEQASPAIPLTADSDSFGVQLSIKMNMWLAQAYSYAPSMLNGTLSLKGNENITIGRYIRNTSLLESYYVEAVDHIFNVSQPDSKGNDSSFSFQTTVQVTRGQTY